MHEVWTEFCSLKPHFTVNKLIAWEKSESGEDSEALAEDQVHSVTEDKSPMADLHRYLASRKAVF